MVSKTSAFVLLRSALMLSTATLFIGAEAAAAQAVDPSAQTSTTQADDGSAPATAAATEASKAALPAAGDQGAASGQGAGSRESGTPSAAEIVVTGSRIARTGGNAPTPVTVIGADRIANTGATNIAEVLNQTPTFRASNGPTVQFVNFTANQIGVRQLDLRGLGSTRTLVLVDGRRFVPSTTQNTVDLNQIPTLLISRTEVVTGGASAAYGSDAVAGVVNVILDNKLEGLRGTAQYGLTEHSDGRTFLGSLAGGTSFLDHRLRVIGGVEYEDRGNVGNCYTRSWCAKETLPVPNSAGASNGLASQVISQDSHASTTAPGGVILGYRTTASAASQVSLYNASTTNPLRGLQFDPSGQTVPFTYGSLYGPTFMVGGSGEGTNPLISGPLLSPAVTRYNGYGHAEMDFTDTLQGFTDLSYGHSRGVTNGAPPRLTSVVINRDNPYLPADVVSSMATVGAQSIIVGRQGGDIGNSVATGTTETVRAAAGLKGDIAGSFKFDTYYQWGRSEYVQTITNNLITTNFNQAVDAVRNSAGQIVCRVNAVTVTVPGCEPINILGVGNASTASQNYAFGTSHQDTVIKQQVAAFNVTGNLFSITSEPVAIATGFEYRRDTVDAVSDPISRALGFYINSSANLNGRSEVKEGYAELNVPLLRDSAVGRVLDLNGAIRRTEYDDHGSRFLGTDTTATSSSTFGATTWKVGAIYEPISALRLRVTRSRDIRAPNVVELYATETATPTAVRSVTITRHTGGNPDLTPEKADTFTGGATLRPSFLQGFSASVDYFDIKVKDAITTLGASTIVDGCAAGDASACALITFNGTTPTAVADFNLNVARLSLKGLDFEVNYRLAVQPLGIFNFRILATRTLKYVTADGINRVGQTGVQTQALPGVPDWTANGLIDFDAGRVGLTAQGRYISRGTYDVTLVGPEDADYVNTAANSISSNRVAARFYLDLTARYTMFEHAGKRVQLFFTANNVFDRDPPVAPANGLATNAIFFDTFGRRFTGGIRFAY